VRRHADRTLLTTWRACVEFVDDTGHRTAAQIAFFAVLSAVPLAMLLVAGFGLMFDDGDVRRRVVRSVLDNVPLSRSSDRARLESTITEALDNTGRLGPFSALVLLASASGVMGALRYSINVAWDLEEVHRSILTRKAQDLALVLLGAVVLVFSITVTLTRRAAHTVDREGGGAVAWLLEVLGDLLPFVFTFGVVLLLYRVLPYPRPRVRDIWPGALVAALLISLVRGGLRLYFAHLSSLGALYGSLGALLALLLFFYAVSNVLVFGAEFASEWSRLPDRDRDVRAELGDVVARVRR
jgi:membrane protein